MSSPSLSEGSALAIAGAIVAVALLLILGVLVKMLDLRHQREAEALALQARISEALLHDRMLFRLPISPTAHVPLWRGRPATIELTGEVPSEELRQAALRLVIREVFEARPDARIESRVSLAPARARHVA